MVELTSGWCLGVERGPDWLFVRLCPPQNETSDVDGIAESIWSLLEQHFVHRLIVEMNEVTFVNSSLLGQLVILAKRVHTNGGMLRLCGLSDGGQDVLRISRLESCLPNYHDRGDAIMGFRPVQPR